MKKLFAIAALLASTAVYAAGPITITVIVSDNDGAETNRVTKVKAASRTELKAWLDEQQIAGNLLKQTARSVSENGRRYIIDNIDGRARTKAIDAAVSAVVVDSSEDVAP